MLAAFIGLPLYGHINPTLEVVRELVKRGHRVVYPTVAQRREIVEATGAEVVVHQTTLTNAVSRRDQWMTRMRLAMLEETRVVLPQLLAKVPTPDLVVHDRAAYWGKLFATKRDLRTIQVVPSFATNAHWAVTQKFAPVDTEAPEYRQYLAKHNALLAEHQIDLSAFRQAEREIVFLPRAFQYEHQTFGDEIYFVGPCLRPAERRWSPPGDKPVVLISLGTVNVGDSVFYRRCLEIFDERWHVVMAIGDKVDAATLGVVPPHYEVMPFVPQLDVLAHACAFVSHGGMGSIMEALHFGVPVLGMPQTPEQEANTVRVVELGLGERVDLDSDIVAAVRRVTTDPELQARVMAMREQVRNAGGAKLAADLIEAGSQNPPRSA